jgi:hypothetical protein
LAQREDVRHWAILTRIRSRFHQKSLESLMI